jgi:hypothetical protein
VSRTHSRVVGPHWIASAFSDPSISRAAIQL